MQMRQLVFSPFQLSGVRMRGGERDEERREWAKQRRLNFARLMVGDQGSRWDSSEASRRTETDRQTDARRAKAAPEARAEAPEANSSRRDFFRVVLIDF